MPVYTVSQVTRYLKDALGRDALLQDLWISGEVSNPSQSGSGHYYFTLKDATGQLRCVMFRGGEGGEYLTLGAAVVAHGSISLYEVRGDLQFYADLVRPEGVGEQYLELERLKVKLRAEGLFEETRKRALPAFPSGIAVITSPLGAVWHDIQSVIRRRYPLVDLMLAPCQVQGNGAVASILEAFQVVNACPGVDLVILARGGGSLEELAPFNEEGVARAIYACKVPVVSAVGHETDWTIADLVADRRAPTPSAAAEMAVPDRRELLAQAAGLWGRLKAAGESGLQGRGERAADLRQRLRLRAPPVAAYRQRVDDLLRLARTSLLRLVALRRERAEALRGRLVTLDPSSVLGRGYALVQREDTGTAVTRVGHASPGDPLSIRVYDGSIRAKVREPDG